MDSTQSSAIVDDLERRVVSHTDYPAIAHLTRSRSCFKYSLSFSIGTKSGVECIVFAIICDRGIDIRLDSDDFGLISLSNPEALNEASGIIISAIKAAAAKP